MKSPNVVVKLVHHLSDVELEDVARKQFDAEIIEDRFGHLLGDSKSTIKHKIISTEAENIVIKPSEVGMKEYKYERVKQKISLDDFSEPSDEEFQPSPPKRDIVKNLKHGST